MRTISALAVAVCLIAACGEDLRPAESQIETDVTTSTITQTYAATTAAVSVNAALEPDGTALAESCAIIEKLMSEILDFSWGALLTLSYLETEDTPEPTRRYLFDTAQWGYSTDTLNLVSDDVLDTWDYIDGNCGPHGNRCILDEHSPDCPIGDKERMDTIRSDLRRLCREFWGPYMTQEEREVWCD